MKHIPIALIAVAASVLGWIAYRAPAPSYVPPKPDAASTASDVPVALTGDIPAGYVTLDIDVEGMCCSGCTGKLYQRMQDLEGVLESAVSFDDGRARAVVAEGFDPEALVASLTFDKYQARLAPPAAH